jgi:hypothetical protein
MKTKLTRFIISAALVLLLFSCTGLFTDKNVSDQGSIDITLVNWNQSIDGTLHVNFTVKNNTKESYDAIEVGIKGNYENGYVVAYGTIYDIHPGEESSGEAYSTYSQGKIISSVAVENYTTTKSGG